MARGKGDGGLYKDSRGFWTAVVELPPALNGDRRRKVIRRKNKRQALDQLNEMKKTVAIYGDTSTTSYTLKEWAEYWVENIISKEVSPGTLRNHDRYVRIYITPLIGRLKLSKVTARHIREFHSRMAKIPKDKDMKEKPEREWVGEYDKLSLGTIRNTHSTLVRMFEAAKEEGHILANVAELAGAPKEGEASREIVALSIEQVKRLLAYVATKPDAAMWSTYLLTGLRRGEVLGLEKDRIDFNKNTIDASWQMQVFKKEFVEKAKADYEVRHIKGTLYMTRPKSEAGWRIIPLVEPLRSVLALHMQGRGDGLIFTTEKGRPMNPNTVGAEWHDLLEGAGIDSKATLHGARHTLVDLLYDAGVPEQVIQQIVGHSTVAMTRSYKTRGNPEQTRKALEALNELLK